VKKEEMLNVLQSVSSFHQAFFYLVW